MGSTEPAQWCGGVRTGEIGKAWPSSIIKKNSGHRSSLLCVFRSSFFDHYRHWSVHSEGLLNVDLLKALTRKIFFIFSETIEGIASDDFDHIMPVLLTASSYQHQLLATLLNLLIKQLHCSVE